MIITGNAGEAISTGRESIEAVVNWFAVNSAELPVAMAVAAGIVLFMLGLRLGGSWLVAHDPDCHHWRGVIGRVLQKTTILFMVATALDIVATYAAVPMRIERLLDILFIIAFALQGAIWARELILGVISRRAGEDPSETAVGNALSIIRVLVSVALFAIAIIVILDNLGVNVTALIAGFGIGGIAIGLAAQGIFSDLFAALSILFDKPFKRGDTIQYDQTTGTVERIGLKTTRLRSLNGELVVMANTKLLEREIHNFAGGRSRRCSLPFGLIYQTDPDQLEKVQSLAKGAVESRKGCKFTRCAILRFGPSSIDFELIFDVGTHRSEQGCRRPHRRRPRRAALVRRARAGVRLSDPNHFHRRARWHDDHALCAASRTLGIALLFTRLQISRMPLASLDEIRTRIGTEIGVSSWLVVDQARIDAFADATEDRQFIHIDPAAAAQTPFGGTIAHGFLTLSLLSRMAADAMLIPDGVKMAVNYGLDRVRFLAPVRSGSRVRGRFTLDSIEEKAPGQVLMRHIVTVEIEGEDKPALTAVWLGLIFT